MCEFSDKTVALKKDKILRVHRRLKELGFKLADGDELPLVVWKWENSNPRANIQQVIIARDEIDLDGPWLFVKVRARKPFAFSGASTIKRYALQYQPELRRELSQTTEYRRQTIQPYIQRPMSDLTQWYVAHKAHTRMREAMDKAAQWNNTVEVREFPVPLQAFPDLNTDEFRLPELLDKDKAETFLRP